MAGQLGIAAQTIKDRVSALDVGHAMGLEIRHGRCRCPIHGGMNYNCALYPGDRGYKCFSCGSAGDVISLVRNVNTGMSFPEAIAWFDDTFHLGLELGKPIDPEKQRRAEMALQRRKRAREYQVWLERMKFDMELTAVAILRQLEKTRDENVPKTADEEWNEKFCTAVRLIPEAERLCEECNMMCTEGKRDGRQAEGGRQWVKFL